MEGLPVELWAVVLARCSLWSLVKLQHVSRGFRELVHSRALWAPVIALVEEMVSKYGLELALPISRPRVIWWIINGGAMETLPGCLNSLYGKEDITRMWRCRMSLTYKMRKCLGQGRTIRELAYDARCLVHGHVVQTGLRVNYSPRATSSCTAQ
jgi:hypothetical protein